MKEVNLGYLYNVFKSMSNTSSMAWFWSFDENYYWL